MIYLIYLSDVLNPSTAAKYIQLLYFFSQSVGAVLEGFIISNRHVFTSSCGVRIYLVLGAGIDSYY